MMGLNPHYHIDWILYNLEGMLLRISLRMVDSKRMGF